MIWALAPLLAIAPLHLPAGQIPDVAVTPYRLRTMASAELARLLVGDAASPFVEAWVEGPTSKWDAISVEIATRSRPTGYAGLCAADFAGGYFMWPPGQRGEQVPARLGMTPYITTRFLVTSDKPALLRTDSRTAECAGLDNLVGYGAWNATAVYHKASLPAADPAIARFAFAAFIAAREIKDPVISTERCYRGAVATPLACNDPAALLHGTYLRDVTVLAVAKCEHSDRFCVDASIASHGEDHVVIETDRSVAALEPDATPPLIRSIRIRAGADPIQ